MSKTEDFIKHIETFFTGSAPKDGDESPITRSNGKYLFLNRTQVPGACWYYLEGEPAVPIKFELANLHGRLIDVIFKTTEYKGQPHEKIVLAIESVAGNSYRLEFGKETAVSKGFFAAAAQHDLTQPFILQPQPSSTDENILFVNLYTSDRQWIAQAEGGYARLDENIQNVLNQLGKEATQAAPKKPAVEDNVDYDDMPY